MDDAEAARSWIEYRRLVLGELERLNASMMVVDRKIDEAATAHRREINQRDTEISAAIASLRVDIAMLQVKSGVWGAAAGIMVVVASILLQLIKH